MTIENRIKENYPNLSGRDLWEAVCAAICREADERRAKTGRQPQP